MAGANCWDVNGCGRQPGGAHVKELGMCPAASSTALHGVHGGINGGRACWVVVGTLCGGKVQGTFAMKHAHCEGCGFYKRVKEEAGPGFILSPLLLRRLRDGGASPPV